MADFIKGKTIVITGAAGGFGRLVSTKAAASGANVVCADVNSDGLKTLVSEIEAAGGTATSIVTDVTDLSQMKALTQHALDNYSAVDVMINNAGIMPLAFFSDHEQAAEAWGRCIDINIKGVLNGMIAAHDPMLSQGRGHIINLSSIYGNHPVVGAAVYGATKTAVNFISESFRVETQGKIKVTIVKPTGVPATGLMSHVINENASVGILGQNLASYGEAVAKLMEGDVAEGQVDENDTRYLVLDPEHIANTIITTIDQPWGVSLGDITIRATGDGYIL